MSAFCPPCSNSGNARNFSKIRGTTSSQLRKFGRSPASPGVTTEVASDAVAVHIVSQNKRISCATIIPSDHRSGNLPRDDPVPRDVHACMRHIPVYLHVRQKRRLMEMYAHAGHTSVIGTDATCEPTYPSTFGSLRSHCSLGDMWSVDLPQQGRCRIWTSIDRSGIRKHRCCTVLFPAAPSVLCTPTSRRLDL